MGIDAESKVFEPNVRPSENAVVDTSTDAPQPLSSDKATAGNAALAALTGTALNAGFYSVVYATSWEPLKRYFLGHPVAIAATILFWFAVAVLFTKWLDVLT